MLEVICTVLFHLPRYWHYLKKTQLPHPRFDPWVICFARLMLDQRRKQLTNALLHNDLPSRSNLVKYQCGQADSYLHRRCNGDIGIVTPVIQSSMDQSNLSGQVPGKIRKELSRLVVLVKISNHLPPSNQAPATHTQLKKTQSINATKMTE